MWKMIIGFVVFAALILYVISQAGDKVDMTGESHGTEAAPAKLPSSAPAGRPAP